MEVKYSILKEKDFEDGITLLILISARSSIPSALPPLLKMQKNILMDIMKTCFVKQQLTYQIFLLTINFYNHAK